MAASFQLSIANDQLAVRYQLSVSGELLLTVNCKHTVNCKQLTAERTKGAPNAC